jgi:hypothetical protein
VGVHVERSVGGCDLGDAGASQPIDHDRTILAVPIDVTVEFIARVERSERRHLRHVRCADVQVLLEAFDDVDQRVGHDHPPHAPTGHRPVLREAVDHERLGMVIEHQRCGVPVDDAVVDLVGDHGDAAGSTRGGDLGECVRSQHGAGRIRGRGEHQPRQVASCVEVCRRRRPPALGPHRDRDGHHPEGQEGVAVARIAGLEHPDPVARLEQREERQREARRRPRNDEHPLDVDPLVALGEAPPQRVQPGSVGVAERLVEVCTHGVTCELRQGVDG